MFRGIETAAAAAVLVVLVLALPAGAQGVCKIGVLGDLKVRMVGSTPVAPVTINGHDDALIVDTGASTSTLGREKADRYRLTKVYRSLLVAGVGGDENGEILLAKTLEVAGIKLAGIPFVATSAEYGADAAGLLGENILRVSDVDFDLANGLMRLIRPSGCSPASLAYWAKEGEAVHEIPIIPASLDHPSIGAYVTVNGVRMSAIFDTGASATIMTRPAALRAGVPVEGPNVRSGGRGYGIGGGVFSSVAAPVALIQIGDEEIRNTRIQVASLYGPGPDILIGADFFLSHRLYLSRDLRKIFFTYNGGPVFSLAGYRRAGRAPGGSAAAETPLPPEPLLSSGASAPAVGAEAADALARRGDADLSRGKVADALRELDAAAASDPKNAGVLYDRARARLAAGDRKGAEADLDAVLERKPADLNALRLKAGLLILARRRPEASSLLAAADRAAAPDDEQRVDLASEHMELGEYEAAAADYDAWLSTHSELGRISAVRGARCRARAFANKDLDGALSDCEAALRGLGGADVAALASEGLIFLRRGDAKRALDAFDAALKRDPAAPWAQYGRGLALYKLGRPQEGERQLEAILAKEPGMEETARSIGLGRPAPDGPAPARGGEPAHAAP